MTTHFSGKLDELDIKLIRELEIDARQTFVALAKKLRISRPTVKAKFQRLLDEHIIEILPIVDPLALGHKTRVNLGFNTLPSEVDTVAEALASHRNIPHVSIYTGRYDVMAWAVLEKSEDLSRFVMKDLTTIAGVTRVETMVNLKIVKISYAYLSDQFHVLRSRPPQQALDTLDIRLIEALTSDALQTQTDIALKLGATRTTIRRKLDRLLDERIIRIAAIADPAVLGYNTAATIGINAQPSRIDAVAQKLAAFRNVHHVLINTGNFDLIVWVVFKGPEDLSRFVREDLGNINGLLSHETMVCLKTAKDDFAFSA